MADPTSIINQALAAYRGSPVSMGTGGLFQYVYPGSGDTEYLVKAGLPVMDAISLIGPGTPRRPTSGTTSPLPSSLIDALNQTALTPDPRPPLTPTPGQYTAGISPAPGLIPGGTQTQFPIAPGATPPASTFAAMHGTPYGTPGQAGYNPGPIDPVSGNPLGIVRGYPSAFSNQATSGGSSAFKPAPRFQVLGSPQQVMPTPAARPSSEPFSFTSRLSSSSPSSLGRRTGGIGGK